MHTVFWLINKLGSLCPRSVEVGAKLTLAKQGLLSVKYLCMSDNEESVVERHWRQIAMDFIQHKHTLQAQSKLILFHTHTHTLSSLLHCSPPHCRWMIGRSKVQTSAFNFLFSFKLSTSKASDDSCTASLQTFTPSVPRPPNHSLAVEWPPFPLHWPSAETHL